MTTNQLHPGFAASTTRARLLTLARTPGSLWLETAGTRRASAQSIISTTPALWLRGTGNFLEIVPGPEGVRGWLRRFRDADPGPGDAFDRLQRIANRLRFSPTGTESPSGSKPPLFLGGLAGCFSYDLGRRFENLPHQLKTEVPWDFQLGLYDEVLLIGGDRAQEIRHHRLPGAPFTLLQRWQQLNTSPVQLPDPKAGLAGTLQTELSQAEHSEAVARIKAEIRAGSVYQANLTFRMRGRCPHPDSPLSTFARLLRDNPAPYAAYLDLPDCTLVSSSPESFLELQRDGRVQSQPIKGTIARLPQQPAEDRAQREKLIKSKKDHAELAMIVDLMRNDIGRVCEPGSVDRNPQLIAEAHPSVWHLVGTVRGQMGQGRDAFDLLRACFPPGSCIGAPKLRAMALLEELERSRRGPYTGAIGWIGLDGTLSLSVAIRTLLFQGQQVSFGVGGGIVYDSEADSEWHEALLKGRALVSALRSKEAAEKGWIESDRSRAGTETAEPCP